ncbi:MAG: VWA domain-containing protein, partial [Candidatus ainarchaeum sp.]|nr:VWA domain-containing protein [Candidatus ainarchaeum sp.]
VCSKTIILKNLLRDANATDSVKITNLANFELTEISASLSGNIGDLVSITQPENSLEPKEFDFVGLNFNIPVDKQVGTYSGLLTVSASNNSECSTGITIFVNSIHGEDASGPVVTNIEHFPEYPTPSDLITIYATASDENTGGSVITNCKLELDYSGIWNFAPAMDGMYNEIEEEISYLVGTLSAGQHTVRIRCTDEKNNLGSPYSYTFYVNATGNGSGVEDKAGPIVINLGHTPYPTTASNMTVWGTATDIYTGNSTLQGCKVKLDSGNWIEIEAEDGAWDSVTEEFEYSFGFVSVGEHEAYYQCTDEWGSVGNIQQDNFLIVDLDLMLVLDRSGSMDYYINSISNNVIVSNQGSSFELVKSLNVLDNTSGTSKISVEIRGSSSTYTVYYIVTINGETIASGSRRSTSYGTLTHNIDLSEYSAPYQLDLWIRSSSSSSYAYNRNFILENPPKKMDAVKSASKTFIDISGSSFQAGLVSYSSSATTDKLLALMNPTNKQAIKNSIDSLVASGGTCIECGLVNGANELTSGRARPDATKIIILLTDGVPTTGNSIDGAVYCRDRNITVYTIGFGYDVNPVELKNIALLTYGEYYFAPDEETLIEIFNTLGRVFKSISG